jgi:hypothetical protein
MREPGICNMRSIKEETLHCPEAAPEPHVTVARIRSAQARSSDDIDVLLNPSHSSLNLSIPRENARRTAG